MWVDPVEAQQKYVERYEERFNYINDCLVCVEGDEGITVYRQEKSVPVWWDCDGVEGTPVGVLRKRKNRWYISTPQEEFDAAMDFMISYAHRNQFILESDLSSAYQQCREHFSDANRSNGYVSIDESNMDDHCKLSDVYRADYLFREMST